MKRSWLINFKEFLARRSKKPWACFETTGPNADGRVAFSISFNTAFARNLQNLGMGGTNDEETVQLFFMQLRMIPEDLVDQEDIVNPEDTPNLSNEANKFVRG